jgi:hypothetical protein
MAHRIIGTTGRGLERNTICVVFLQLMSSRSYIPRDLRPVAGAPDEAPDAAQVEDPQCETD